VILRQVSAAHPAGVHDVGGRPEAPALQPANVVHDNVVVLDALSLPRDAVKRGHDLQRLDVQAGLFFQFAPHPVGQFFPEFEHSSGNGPLALMRLAAAANEEGALAMNNHSAHAHDRSIWIFSFHPCY
jgi:hypothetical protein